jgi:hypothetical protein
MDSKVFWALAAFAFALLFVSLQRPIDRFPPAGGTLRSR